MQFLFLFLSSVDILIRNDNIISEELKNKEKPFEIIFHLWPSKLEGQSNIKQSLIRV